MATIQQFASREINVLSRYLYLNRDDIFDKLLTNVLRNVYAGDRWGEMKAVIWVSGNSVPEKKKNVLDAQNFEAKRYNKHNSLVSLQYNVYMRGFVCYRKATSIRKIPLWNLYVMDYICFVLFCRILETTHCKIFLFAYRMYLVI